MNAREDWSEARSLMERAVDEGVFPGGVLLVARGEDVLLEEAFGCLEQGGERVSTATVYDVSSLTKPLVTVASLLASVAGDLALLERPVGELLPAWDDGGGDGRRGVTPAHLLAHRSGLPARPLYFEGVRPAEPGGPVDRAAVERIVAAAVVEDLEALPGRRTEYSDVGFIVLGALVEALTGAPLDAVFGRNFGDLLESSGSGFRPPGRAARDSQRIAPAGRCAWRGRVVRGEVQDENAWALGGVAGHAGLFATAGDVHRLTLEFVRAYAGRASRLDPAAVRKVWSGRFAADSTWALGWDTPTPGASSAGSRISNGSFGHLGFTGSSVWVDCDRGVQVILLSNRVHPDPAHAAIREFRPRLHDAVFEALDAKAGKGDPQ